MIPNLTGITPEQHGDDLLLWGGFVLADLSQDDLGAILARTLEVLGLCAVRAKDLDGNVNVLLRLK